MCVRERARACARARVTVQLQYAWATVCLHRWPLDGTMRLYKTRNVYPVGVVYVGVLVTQDFNVSPLKPKVKRQSPRKTTGSDWKPPKSSHFVSLTPLFSHFSHTLFLPGLLS